MVGGGFVVVPSHFLNDLNRKDNMNDTINPIIKAGGFTYQPKPKPKVTKKKIEEFEEFEEIFREVREGLK